MASSNIGESRDSFSDTQIGQALSLCKDTTRDHVLQMITTGFDIALQKLETKRADATAEEQTNINNGIREIQEKESRVRDRYKRNFETWFDTDESPLDQHSGDSSWYSGGLSLVDRESLEQQIIVERMAGGAAAETRSQYAHLNRRFCLLKAKRIKPVDSPIGPKAQGKLLVDALDAIDVSSEVRILGLRVMEQHFPEALGYLYLTLNEKLIEMGFMPEIRHHIWRTADILRGGRGQSSAGMSESQRQVIDDRKREASADDIGSMLKDLLGSRLGEDHQDEDESIGQNFLDERGQLSSVIEELLKLLSGDQSVAVSVYERFESLGLIDSLYRLQSLFDDSIQVASVLDSAQLHGDQLAAQKLWFGKRIKPGVWLTLPHNESNSSSCCRLYRIYEEGQRCVFVDGLGLKAAEYTAKEAQVRLEDGRIKIAS